MIIILIVLNETMKKKSILLFLLLFALFSSSVYAHPGRTDSDGGHYDRSTGEYHYHHGYSAHQHDDGVCPYDVDVFIEDSDDESSDDVPRITNDDSDSESFEETEEFEDMDETEEDSTEDESETISYFLDMIYIVFDLSLIALMLFLVKVRIKTLTTTRSIHNISKGDTMTIEERKNRIAVLESDIHLMENGFKSRRKKRNIEALLFLSALWFIFFYITDEITSILTLLICIPVSLILGGFSYFLITQTSHIKKWVRTLKNQYFSSQNSNYAAHSPYNMAFCIYFGSL